MVAVAVALAGEAQGTTLSVVGRPLGLPVVRRHSLLRGPKQQQLVGGADSQSENPHTTDTPGTHPKSLGTGPYGPSPYDSLVGRSLEIRFPVPLTVQSMT